MKSLRLCQECGEAEAEPLHLDSLTEAEKTRYRDGDWLSAHPVKSEALDHLRREGIGRERGEDAAAELWARVRIALGVE